MARRGISVVGDGRAFFLRATSTFIGFISTTVTITIATTAIIIIIVFNIIIMTIRPLNDTFVLLLFDISRPIDRVWGARGGG